MWQYPDCKISCLAGTAMPEEADVESVSAGSESGELDIMLVRGVAEQFSSSFGESIVIERVSGSEFRCCKAYEDSGGIAMLDPDICRSHHGMTFILQI